MHQCRSLAVLACAAALAGPQHLFAQDAAVSALDQAMDGTWEFSMVGPSPSAPPIVHRVRFADGRFDRSPLNTAAGEFTMKNYQPGGDISFAAAYQGDGANGTLACDGTVSQDGNQMAGRFSCGFGSGTFHAVREAAVPDLPTMKLTLGGTAALRVRLTLKPDAAVTVHAQRKRGDKSLAVAETELTFTTDNWNQPQEIALDASGVSHAGTAVILVTGASLPATSVTVKLVQPH